MHMKVAAIQAAPVFLDAQATTDKALTLMREAAANGADLCAFPETFVSGYPVWAHLTDSASWNGPFQKEAFAAYVRGSISLDGPELAAVADNSRELGIFPYLGFVERSASGGSVYCSLAAIDPERGVLSVHRKLRPTHAERMFWAADDGQGLQVHEFKGVKVGGLNCWENWMPLARYSLYGQGEQLHVGTWPGSPNLTRDITKFIAQEGRVYSMAVGGVIRLADVPDAFPLKSQLAESGDVFMTGGSMIVSPDGKTMAEAPTRGEEAIVYADIDVDVVRGERQNFDPAGHYARPDVFNLTVNRERQEPIG